MLRIFLLASLTVVGCSKSKTEDKSPPPAPAAKPLDPAAAAKPAEAVKPASGCFDECIAKGPDQSKPGQELWATLSKDQKQDDCTEFCLPGKVDEKPAAAAAPAAGCYEQCLANGPDDSPMTKADWPKKSKTEKDNDCSATCADVGMPVDAEHTK